MIPISEIERRAEYLQEIGNDHPLMWLICQCLSNMPARRPEAHEIVSIVMSTRLPAVPNMIELLHNVKRNESENQILRSQIDTMRSEIQSLSSENEMLRSENHQLQLQSELQVRMDIKLVL